MITKIENIIKDGKKNLQLVFDFDGTLIEYFVGDTKVPSVISILRNENHLDDDYKTKAHELYNFYSKIEQDTSILGEEKTQRMEEWWTKHKILLIQKGIHIDHIKAACSSPLLVFRPGVEELLTLANTKNIPILILSAAGLGVESIRFLLERDELLFPNIKIISNSFVFNNDGLAIDFVRPLIHSQNKILPESENLKLNTILVGDGLNDANMVENSQNRVIYRIGIADGQDGDKLIKYKELFDEVWSENISFSPLIKIINNL